MAKYDGSIRINTKIDSKNASAQLMSLENRIVKTADKIAALRSKMDSLKDVQIPTQEYKSIETDIAKAETELGKLIEKQAQMQNEGKDSGAAWDRLNQRIQASKDYIEIAREEMQQLVNEGKAFTLGKDTDQYAKLGQQLEYAENEMNVLNQRHDELIAKQNKNADGYRRIGKAARDGAKIANKSVKSMNDSFKVGLKSILKYGFGIRSVYALINKLRSAIKEGFSNLYNDKNMTAFKNQVDGLKASMLTLKNSFAAAFRPLVEMAIPYIQMTTDALSRLLDAANQFTAAIAGQKTYTKAIKQTTEALKDQNKVQSKQLSSLDKLNNITTGSGEDDAKTSEMFEELPVDTKIGEFAEKIKQNFLDIFSPLKEAWEEYGDSITGNLSKILKKFKDFGKKITSTTSKWFSKLDWKPLISSVDELLIKLQPTVDLISDGLSWAWENVLLPFGGWAIEEALPSALDAIGSAIELISKVAEKAAPWLKDIWDNFLEPVANFVGDAITKFFEVLGQVLSDVADNEIAVTILTGVATAIGLIVAAITAWNTVQTILNALLAANPIALVITAIAGLITIITLAITYWDDITAAVQKFWDKCVEVFSDIGAWFKERFDKIKEVVSNAWDAIKEKTGEIWDGIKSSISAAISAIKSAIANFLGKIKSAWSTSWNGIKSVVGTILGKISATIFTSLTVIKTFWNSIWRGLKNTTTSIFNGIWRVIRGVINSILGGIESMANGVVDGINTVIKAMNNLSFDIPKWIPGIGGNSFGFDIPKLSRVSIPRLATGTVVPPNKEFLAVLGDNKKEPEIVSPVSTIKQAVLEAITEAGGIGSGGEITIKIPVDIDGRVLFELIKKFDLEQYRRTGRPSFRM